MTYYVFGSRILMQGKKGRDVELLQHLLRKMPFLLPKGIRVDGQFDETLKRAVQRLQRVFREEEDGVVGRDTYRLLGLEVDEYWPSSLPPPGMRSLRIGTQGRDVMVLQNRLAASRRKYADSMRSEISGCFGKGTERALRLFQADCGLKMTGVFDDAACFALYRLTGVGSRCLQYGSPGHDCGYDVFCLQKRLQEKGFLQQEADGVFSLETEIAVRQLQQAHQLPATGIVKSQTCFILGR